MNTENNPAAAPQGAPGLIKQLASILKKGDTLTLVLAIEDAGGLRVNLYPKLHAMEEDDEENKRNALNQTLTLTGTADEMDSPEFLDSIRKFTDSITGLRTTLDEAETAHKSAAASKSKTPAKPATPTKPTTGGPKRPVIAPKPAAPKPATKLPSRPAIGKGQPAKPAVLPKAPAAADAPAALPAGDNTLKTAEGDGIAKTGIEVELPAEGTAGLAGEDEHNEAAQPEATAAEAAPEPEPAPAQPKPQDALSATEDLM